MAKKRLPGMEPDHIPELTEAAEAYDRAKKARMKKTEVEKETKDSLLEKMLKHKLTSYETPDGLKVVVTEKNNVRTEAPSSEEEDDA